MYYTTEATLLKHDSSYGNTLRNIYKVLIFISGSMSTIASTIPLNIMIISW